MINRLITIFIFTFFIATPVYAADFLVDNYKEKIIPNDIPHMGVSKVKIANNIPFIEVQKWDTEVNLGLIPIGSYVLQNGVWTNGNESISFNESTTSINIDIKFANKPITQSFSLQMSNYLSLDFFKQNPLWMDIGLSSPTKSCSDTDCVHDGITEHRDTDVVNSYAVYYKDHSDYIIGNKNYGTGKVFHISRPKLIDGNGKIFWLDLNISNGVITEIIPDDVYNNKSIKWEGAVIDPDIGYTTAGASTSAWSATLPVAFGYYNTASTITVTSISSYGSGSVNAKHLLWTGNGSNAPQTYLFQHSPITIGASAQWNTSTGSDSLSSGDFWFSFAVSGSSYTHYYDSVTADTFTKRCYTSGTYTNPESVTWGSCSYTSNRRGSIYLTYTSGGGSSVTVTDVFIPVQLI